LLNALDLLNSDCSDHIKQKKINKAYSMLGILRRNFKEIAVESFISLYKLFVRSHLEYAESVWNPAHWRRC